MPIKSIKKNKSNVPFTGGAEEDIIEKEDFEESSGDDENDAPGPVIETENDPIEGKDEDEEVEEVVKNEEYSDSEPKENLDDVEENFDNPEDDACVYKFIKKSGSDSDVEGEEVIFDDDIAAKDLDEIVKPEERETKPILTKYERVRILGDRAKQLSLGAKPMLLNVDNLNPKEIAKLELERGVIPFIIEKPLPDGRRERWKVSELRIVN
jgi:DNA-directed RNA polymerase subunit K/omega